MRLLRRLVSVKVANGDAYRLCRHRIWRNAECPQLKCGSSLSMDLSKCLSVAVSRSSNQIVRFKGGLVGDSGSTLVRIVIQGGE